MKSARIVVLAFAAVLLAAGQDKASPRKEETTTLPAGAKQSEPGVYRYTDRDGKTWVYRKSPFGYWKDDDAKAIDKSGDVSDITAVEDGDNVRFERPGPFGKYRWVRKKSEMNDAERKAWESRSKASKSAGQE